MSGEKKFEYSYTAPTEREREEIKEIRKSYLRTGDTEVKLAELRRLDGKVNRLPRVAGILCGILGTLIFGTGLCMSLVWNLYVWGSVVGIVGAGVLAFALWFYKFLLRRRKKKYADEILKLSTELLNEKEE